VGLVVQPGLEFAPDHIHAFDPVTPDRLSPVLRDRPGLSFEAHSTDYQVPDVYPELGRRHFAVLKVGPALTHAYRQAVYALEGVSDWIGAEPDRPRIPAVMEDLMLTDPVNWRKHYSGSEAQLHLLRHFSYADRIRYYWTQPAARQAVERLMSSSARSGRRVWCWSNISRRMFLRVPIAWHRACATGGWLSSMRRSRRRLRPIMRRPRGPRDDGHRRA
jgi:tagatose-1,6-bisphosphate aldolase non-catalytic subunit AgaZ/GatZ